MDLKPLRMLCLPLLALALALALASCAKKTEGGAEMMAAAPPVAGMENAPGNFLAYSHRVGVRLPADQIGPRLAEVRAACLDQRHGTCTVLGEQQSAGEWPSGELVLRAEPKAIEPLVAAAAGGDEIARRSTEAEDLADAVRDNGLRQQRLRIQHERLSEFLARKDVKAEDLIALSTQLSEIESQLQFAEQEAAQQRRRLETNRLEIDFEASRVTVETSELRMAFRDALGVLDTSVAVLVTVVVAVLPFAVFGLALAWGLRAWLRRRRRQAA